MTTEYYKGCGIDYNVYGLGEYSVTWWGNDFELDTIEEAKDLIDSVVDGYRYEVVDDSGVYADDILTEKEAYRYIRDYHWSNVTVRRYKESA